MFRIMQGVKRRDKMEQKGCMEDDRVGASFVRGRNREGMLVSVSCLSSCGYAVFYSLYLSGQQLCE